MRKTLDPKNDVVFKMLFAHPAHRRSLIALLTAVLSPSVPIREAKVLNPEIPRILLHDRGIVLDIHVVLDDERHIDVEMQVQVRKGVSNRFLYYWARLFGSQLAPTEPYSRLRPCISVLFLGESLLPGDRFHSTFRVEEIHDHYELSDALELHIIELSKLAKALADDKLIGWGRFFAADSDEELEALAMIDPQFAEAKAALDVISADEQARELARQRGLDEAALAIYVGESYDAGLDEGLVKGLSLAVHSMAELLGLPLEEARRQKLQTLDASQLEQLAEHLRRKHSWPE